MKNKKVFPNIKKTKHLVVQTHPDQKEPPIKTFASTLIDFQLWWVAPLKPRTVIILLFMFYKLPHRMTRLGRSASRPGSVFAVYQVSCISRRTNAMAAFQTIFSHVVHPPSEGGLLYMWGIMLLSRAAPCSILSYPILVVNSTSH